MISLDWKLFISNNQIRNDTKLKIDMMITETLVHSSQPRVTSFRDLMHEAEDESDEEEGQR